MNKKGISGVVVTVILVAMAVGLVAVVWVVVANMIDEGLGSAVSGSSRVTLEIDDAGLKTTATGYSVKVERKVGEGELAKIKFILTDSEDNSKVVEFDSSMEQSESARFDFDLTLFGEDGLKDIVEIKVVPIILIDDEERELGATDTLEIEEMPVTAEDDLVGYWKFDNTFSDSSGNRNDGVNSGVEFVEDTERGTVGSFDGNSYVEVPSSTGGNDGTFSASMWIRLEGTDQIQGFFGVGRRWLIRDVSGSVLFRDAEVSPNVDIRSKDIGEDLKDGRWHFLVAVYGSEDVLYFDGKKVKSISSSVKPTSVDKYKIGNAGFSNFVGKLDDVRIYNKALSEIEVKMIYLE